MEELKSHAPELQTRRGQGWLILRFAGIVAIVSLFYVWVDRVFAEWMPDGEILITAIGFLILSLFFRRKKLYQQRYGPLAYQNAARDYALPGLAILIACIAHISYMPGPLIPDVVWWKPILFWAGVLLVFLGAALWVRSAQTIGVDNLSLLYVYFPEESKLVNLSIYSILRHPIYGSALYISIGLAFMSGNWFALVVVLLLPVLWTGWIRLVEEKELINRFPGYVEYRKQVPAFFPKIRDLYRLSRFLVLGS
jgi:protein-S-isoprenylcysteine O-methyltransferase Ste14